MLELSVITMKTDVCHLAEGRYNLHRD